MGPMASVGDTIQGVLVKPLVSLIGAGMAAEGNWLSILMVTLPTVSYTHLDVYKRQLYQIYLTNKS